VQEGHILSAGLDPYLGCFHQTEYGRLSLVLDLIEEFRPVCIDAIVLNLLNTNQISRNDFVRGGLDLTTNHEEGEYGVYLGDVGRRLFLKVFFERLRSIYRSS
ncbi:MAG: CRISPR-associated endonuclease Cas1, partial [Candidatus Calescibacterium sp.]|nr:CRISPR-associated endonuclease Cas1 [Candidatus Calescibacterium sp.]